MKGTLSKTHKHISNNHTRENREEGSNSLFLKQNNQNINGQAKALRKQSYWIARNNINSHFPS